MRQSWNQSRQVIRLPVQLWKYSWAMIASTLLKSASVAVSWRGQHVLVVEDVEALVLHRPHVEVGHRHDHEDVEIVFASERLLVPPHGTLERTHGIAGAVLLAGLDEDFERDLAAGHGDEAVLHHAQHAADQREQVARLGERIVPHRIVPRGARDIAGLDQIAVGQQHRRLRLVRLDPRGEHRHDVGPVGEIGDAAEPFRLALGGVGFARAIEAHQLGVGGRVELGLDLQHEGPVGRLQHGETFGRRDEGVRGQRLAVEGDRTQHQFVAVEHDGSRRRRLRIGPEREPGADPGAGGVERDIEVDRLHQPVRRAIVSETDGNGLFCAHALHRTA